MLGQVGFDGELDSTELALKLPLALVVHGLLVVLQGGPVAELGGAQGARDHLPGVSSPDVSVQAGPSGELGLALIALELLLGRVGLHVSGQSLLVLEGGPAGSAREGLVGHLVQLLVGGQVVPPGEGLVAEPAAELLKVGLVGPLVPLEAVAPFEGLAAV